MGWDVGLVERAPATAACGVGVYRHSPERTPHIRRVELGVAPTGEHQIVVHPLLADPNPLGELAAAMLAKRVDAERRPL